MQLGMVSVYYHHSSTIAMSHCLNESFLGSSLLKGSRLGFVGHIIHYLVYHIHCKVVRNRSMLRNSMVYHIYCRCIVVHLVVVTSVASVVGGHIIHCLETLAIAIATDIDRIDFPFGFGIILVAGNSIDYVLVLNVRSLGILARDNMILVNLLLDPS